MNQSIDEICFPAKIEMPINDESVVTYNQDVYYVFVSEKSIGNPREYKITTLNITLIVSYIYM